MRAFECPRCFAPLSKIKTGYGLVFGCRTCDGRAVGFALLRNILGISYVNSIWLGAPKASRGGRCPACHKPMAQIPVSVPRYRQDVQIDLCRRCYLAWFDKSELEAIPHKSPTAGPDPYAGLPMKAREQLALSKIEDLKRRTRREDALNNDNTPSEAWQWLPGILGMPVEENTEPLTSLPLITWGLTAIMVAVFLATWGNLRHVIDNWGMIPASAARHGGMTFVTAFFLHGGIFHLIGNSYFLMVFGDNVEDFLGKWRYAALIAGATMAGHMLHSMGHPDSTIPCVGASGGISGIIVYYALKFPHARLKMLFHYFLLFRWVSLPAFVALILWIGYQIMLAYMQVKGLSNVSALAHLGGAGIGFIFWILWHE